MTEETVMGIFQLFGPLADVTIPRGKNGANNAHAGITNSSIHDPQALSSNPHSRSGGSPSPPPNGSSLSRSASSNVSNASNVGFGNSSLSRDGAPATFGNNSNSADAAAKAGERLYAFVQFPPTPAGEATAYAAITALNGTTTSTGLQMTCSISRSTNRRPSFHLLGHGPNVGHIGMFPPGVSADGVSATVPMNAAAVTAGMTTPTAAGAMSMQPRWPHAHTHMTHTPVTLQRAPYDGTNMREDDGMYAAGGKLVGGTTTAPTPGTPATSATTSTARGQTFGGASGGQAQQQQNARWQQQQQQLQQQLLQQQLLQQQQQQAALLPYQFNYSMNLNPYAAYSAEGVPDANSAAAAQQYFQMNFQPYGVGVNPMQHHMQFMPHPGTQAMPGFPNGAIYASQYDPASVDASAVAAAAVGNSQQQALQSQQQQTQQRQPQQHAHAQYLPHQHHIAEVVPDHGHQRAHVQAQQSQQQQQREFPNMMTGRMPHDLTVLQQQQPIMPSPLMQKGVQGMRAGGGRGAAAVWK